MDGSCQNAEERPDPRMAEAAAAMTGGKRGKTTSPPPAARGGYQSRWAERGGELRKQLFWYHCRGPFPLSLFKGERERKRGGFSLALPPFSSPFFALLGLIVFSWYCPSQPRSNGLFPLACLSVSRLTSPSFSIPPPLLRCFACSAFSGKEEMSLGKEGGAN